MAAAYTTEQLTLELIEQWRPEPGLGVSHLNNVLADDPNAQLIQLWVGNVAVACLVAKYHGAGYIVDLIVKQDYRGQGYGRDVALKGFDKLSNEDNAIFIQLNVTCRRENRTALTKIVKHCAEKLGLDGGPQRGCDTWMLMRRTRRQLDQSTLDCALPQHAAGATELAAAAPFTPEPEPRLPWWAM